MSIKSMLSTVMIRLGINRMQVRCPSGSQASIKGLIVAIAMVHVCFRALSSPVKWDAFSMTDVYEYGGYGHQSISAEFSDIMSYPCVNMRVDKGKTGLSVSAAVPMPGLLAADWVIAVFANPGDVLTWDYFKNAPVALDNHAQDGPGTFAELTAPVISGSETVKYGSTVYLAMLFWTDDTPGYTWCSLKAYQSGLSMEENATAFQEGLIVGTGSIAPTPEPSSAVLILLGCAGLLLKRRREF